MHLPDDPLRILVAIAQPIPQQPLQSLWPKAARPPPRSRLPIHRLLEHTEVPMRPRTHSTGDSMHCVAQCHLFGGGTHVNESFQPLLRQIDAEPEQPLHRHLPVPERLVGKDLAPLASSKTRNTRQMRSMSASPSS